MRARYNAFIERHDVVVDRQTGHVTWKYFVADADRPLLEHVTVTGQMPGVVREPTSQVQLTAPAALAVFGPSPDAFDGPDLYVTVMVQ